ncbi:class I SAM-dependent methyltransferase [Sphingobium sp. WTD-1]|jgi:SAM-dependent methyltransferase|uniref:class I SAM-dependent methyltransferase n=1 Tax=Sphingobium sp. WTD-1 TaxID=2979467 RepID=UPI0024DE42B3|nr:class I SAM-dependent methyltransferase [Sphingobium sp. WTD-1]WIA55837.1 class I SAM-dependent methyltransferase [Sphingobium sp. WTD-1]
MDQSAYASMSAQEGEHWWFVARRAILETLIRSSIAPPQGARILEAGCGTGGNLAMLAAHGTVDALEYDAGARALARARGIGRVEPGMLPHKIGFDEDSYDLIAVLDVLEHVEQDRASLAALRTRLASGGRILLTVPAVPWLWSDHDVLHHHKRRYTRASLVRVAREAGLTVEAVGYFNSLLFPLAMTTRMAQRLLKRKSESDVQPSPPVNGLLRRIFAWERHLLGRIRFPIGLSLYAILSV